MPRTATIQSTTDYDQFRFLEANRVQYRGHVEKLKSAFEEIGNLTQVQPILVNDRHEIIDGQHRFTACKELGLPIFYTTVPGLGVHEARSMNILHRNWTSDDYARSYANSGDSSYQRYMKLREDYGLSHSVLLAYINGVDNRKGIFSNFREGTLSFTPEQEKDTRKRLDMLMEIEEYTHLARERGFAMAFLKALGSEQYDHSEMVRKISLHGHILRRYAILEDNLRQIEEVYNFGRREGNRVRLY